jgi:plasmid stabilization system protein ParE
VRHRLHPEADAEFAEAIRYYAEITPELGARFYREMERLIRDVCAHPDRFHKFDPPARRHFSAQFPYAVICLVKPDQVWIVAIMHMKRKPGYWRDRVR